MPSPFPGMDPFLEQSDVWQDFHQSFLIHGRDGLNSQVGPNYLVKVEVRLILHERSAEEKHLSLEIRDRRNRRVITVLELLSPSNKTPGADRDDYMAKRRQVLSGQTHLVEIDFRRSGQRPSPPELPPCDYYALVSRYEDRPAVGFWPIGLREPLPNLPIPLAETDAPVHLDLKAVLDRTYDLAGYGKYIYQETPEPPLSAQDERWARTTIAGAVE